MISTIEITGFSLLMGTVLGFALFSLYSRSGKIVKRVIASLESITHLVPAVIILMVFYYILFGDVQIPGQMVAGATFSLLFRYAGEKNYASEDTENQLAWKLLYRHVASFGGQKSPEKPYTQEASFTLKKKEDDSEE